MPFLAPLGGIIGGLLGSFGAFLSSGTILAGIVKAGLGLAAQFALGKIFAPKVPPQKVHLETVYGEDSPRFVVLGKRAVRGHHVFRNAHSKGNRVIEDVYIVSHFRSAGVTRVRWEGEWQTLSEGVWDDEKGWRIPNTKENAKVWVKVYTGAPDQTADAYLIEDSGGRWSEDHRGAGLTYAIVTQVLDREDLPQPWGDIFEVEGLCYDWREDDTAGGEGDQRWNDPSTWAPSENPFVQMYNLERGFFIGDELIVGKGISPSRLPLDKWTLAANIADEGVTVGAVSKSRYASSLVAIAGPASTHAGNMEPLLAAAAATWVEAPAGEWPIAGANRTPVASITDDDLMVEEAERISLKRTRSELVNTIAGSYQSPDTFYESAPLATTIDTAALAEDGERLAANIPYEAVTRADVGDRLNDIYVRASRYQASAEICLAPKHRFLQPGEWITWTSSRAGGFTKTFEVLTKRLGPLGEKSARAVYVTLQEVAEGIFDPTEYITVPPTPAGPIAPTYLDEVTIVSITGVERTTETGAKRPQIRVEWTPITAAIDPTVTHVEIAYRLVEEPDSVLYQTVTADVSVAYLASGVVGNSDYEVRTKLITLPERAITPSAWYPVTTTDTRMGRVDVYAGVVDRTALADDVGDLVDWITETGFGLPDELALLDSALTAVEVSLGDVTASGLFKMSAAYTPATGWDSRIGLQARVDTGDTFKAAGLFLEATATESRVLILADQFVIADPADGETAVNPFVFEGGAAYMENAYIGTVYFKQMSSFNGKLVLKGSGTDASIELFS